MVNHPAHYEDGPFECIQLSERYAFCAGNAIKYVYRHRLKGRPVEDLDKALWYLRRAASDPDETGGLHTPEYQADALALGLLEVLVTAEWPVPETVPFWKAMRACEANDDERRRLQLADAAVKALERLRDVMAERS